MECKRFCDESCLFYKGKREVLFLFHSESKTSRFNAKFPFEMILKDRDEKGCTKITYQILVSAFLCH